MQRINLLLPNNKFYIMFRIKGILILILIGLLMSSCSKEDTADLIIFNAHVYTVDSLNPNAEAVAIKKDKIYFVGTNEDVLRLSGKDTKQIDAKEAFLMPGFIEGHGHLLALGESLQILNFSKSSSWKAIVDQISDAVSHTPKGVWIIGRGWHQDKWNERPEEEVFGFPVHDRLSKISPDNPVFLHHASGHAIFANEKAIQLAGVSAETADPKGGKIIRNAAGQPTGLFQEKAEEIILDAYEHHLKTLDQEEQLAISLERIEIAQEECLKKGITSFQDAGSDFEMIKAYKKLAIEKKLKLRLWVMLRQSYDDMEKIVNEARTIGYANNYFTCRAIKSEVDGALGTYGAWLLEPYSDKPGYRGQNTTSLATIDSIAGLAFANDMQLCVHAIGDKANREIINLYEHYLNTANTSKNLRWRIEHAQHLDPEDIPRLGVLGIIASMQGIHCTSDAPFVEDRLGTERAKKGAYVWRSLLDNNVIIANGTDTPIEDVDPIQSFYASVTRTRKDNGMVFFQKQKMTRAEALYSYTLGNAYAAFEEDIKGSIKEGKLADLVLLSKDLEKCANDEILETEVLMTIVGGEFKYISSEIQN